MTVKADVRYPALLQRQNILLTSTHLFCLSRNVRPSLHSRQAPIGMTSTDRDALIALYESTDGKAWKKNDNWGSTAPLSEWFGLEVDDKERVVKIDLTDNNLRGTYLACPTETCCPLVMLRPCPMIG